MNPDYAKFLKASVGDRRDVILGTSQRLGTAPQNVEKDFWVCWTLDALFNGLPTKAPRLLFKGGTSLSKGYNLIERFSEDVDVTVFRDDLGEDVSVEQLTGMSRKKREQKLDEIKAACQAYIARPLHNALDGNLQVALKEAGIANKEGRIELDPDDADRQTLLFWYPSVTERSNDYVRKAVKIESGAKSALDPHELRTVTPYIDADLTAFELAVPNVTIVQPVRTFWDKIIILHGLRRWFDNRGALKGGGQRVSRHYYDVHMLSAAGIADAALDDEALGADCVAHARLFFNRPDLDLEHAAPGTYSLTPSKEMLNPLRRDYDAMAGMIFGEVPSLDQVLARVSELETRLNKTAP